VLRLSKEVRLTVGKMSDARLFVEYCIAARGLQLMPYGSFALGRAISDYAITFYLDYRQFLRDRRFQSIRAGEKLTKSDIKDALYEWVEEEKPNVIYRYTDRVRCEKENLEPLNDYCKLIFNKEDIFFESRVLAHFIWQVKRKALGKTVKDHLCPVFYGGQGYGKSYAFSRLIEPFSDYVYNLSAHNLNSLEKIGFKLAGSLVAFMDELEGLNRADVNAVKNVITAKTLDVRVYNTQDFVTVPQKCTFIGATNKPLSEVFYDPTGMRRFAELTAPVGKSIDFKKLKETDIYAIWKGIDENRDAQYLDDIKEDLMIHQNSLTPQELGDMFMQENYLEPVKLYDELYKDVSEAEKEIYNICLDDIYGVYSNWCEEKGAKRYDVRWLGRKLTNKGFDKKVLRDGLSKKRKTYYALPFRAIKNLSLESKMFEAGKKGDIVKVNFTKHREV
jgi:hypothetical protein